MLRYQASCNDREAAEAALDQLLLMTATFSTTWNSTETRVISRKPFPCTLKSDAERYFKINTLKKVTNRELCATAFRFLFLYHI